MNVILDCERMKYPYTGLYEYCHQLGLSLQKIIDKQHLCYYIPESGKDIFGLDSKCIIQKSLHKIFMPSFDAAVYHITYQNTHYMPKNKKLKKVLTIHDLNFLYEKQDQKKIDKYLKQVQQNIDRVDSLVAISEYAKNDTLKYLNTGGKPFDVIYNGCNVLEFEGFDNPVYRPKNGFLFSIGTVLPKKNFHVLPGLLQKNNFELIIAGKTNQDYVNKIMEVAISFNVQDRVKVLGPISYEDKYWFLKNCDAFMFPSIAEGFGIPVVEAMHYGKPVFLSTLTSLPEVGGDHAYYFQNFDIEHMQQIFESGMNDYINNQRSSDIIKHSALFNWDKCAQEYFDVYQRLL